MRKTDNVSLVKNHIIFFSSWIHFAMSSSANSKQCVFIFLEKLRECRDYRDKMIRDNIFKSSEEMLPMYEPGEIPSADEYVDTRTGSGSNNSGLVNGEMVNGDVGRKSIDRKWTSVDRSIHNGYTHNTSGEANTQYNMMLN